MSKLEVGTEDNLHFAKHLDQDGELQFGIVEGNMYAGEGFLHKGDAILLIAHLQHTFSIPVKEIEVHHHHHTTKGYRR